MSRAKSRKPVKFPDLAKRVRKIRELSVLTQGGFAARIGVARPQVSFYEHGIDRPRRATILNICREFGVEERWLTEGVGPIYKEGAVGELPERYGLKVRDIPDALGKLGRKERKLLREIEELLASGDEGIKGHLRRQVEYLWDAFHHRKRNKKS